MAYGLIERGTYAATPLTKKLAAPPPAQVYEEFARHILLNLGGLRVVDVDQDGPAGRQNRLVPNDILVAMINPQPRRELKSAEDLQRVLAGVREGSYVSFMVYNVDFQQTRIVNLRVGK